MEHTIEEIMEFIRKRAGGYGWIDQISIYNEITRRMEEESRTCLLMEYGFNQEDEE